MTSCPPLTRRNVGTSGKCSKCHRETEQQQQQVDAVSQKAVAAIVALVPSEAAVSAAAPPAAPLVAQEAGPSQDETPPAPSGPTRYASVEAKRSDWAGKRSYVFARMPRSWKRCMRLKG